jgi:hypothetical protein
LRLPALPNSIRPTSAKVGPAIRALLARIFPQVPEIVIDLIDRPIEKPWGAGEPAASVISSAISNAVFEATGVRLRSIPYTPTKVKAAIQAS